MEGKDDQSSFGPSATFVALGSLAMTNALKALKEMNDEILVSP